MTGQHLKNETSDYLRIWSILETMACKVNSLVSFSKGKNHTIIKSDTADVGKKKKVLQQVIKLLMATFYSQVCGLMQSGQNVKLYQH